MMGKFTTMDIRLISIVQAFLMASSTTTAPSQSPTAGAPPVGSASPTVAQATSHPTYTRVPTHTPVTIAPTQTAAPTHTLTPTRNPTTKNPTNSPTTCSPSTCGPTTGIPTLQPSDSPTTSNPTETPNTIGPTTAAPSASPTFIPSPVYHEPDVDGHFWTQTVTNAGKVVWSKLPKSNVTGYGPLVFVDTPTSVEKWTINRSIVLNWHVENVPSSFHVKIELYRDHYHPRHYVKTIVANHPVINSGINGGTFRWDRVHVDPGYSIDNFYVVHICLIEQSNICGTSKGVARIEQNVQDQTHIPGGTGLIGTRYEWEKINIHRNFHPAEGYPPNSPFHDYL
mmetsp:Transcript_6329/g.10509  ORF Transcript_6329/g.10509 Transcript_6329/m.10509 type:complete len:339 (+) Transcript_6329:74-1090(+)